MKTNESQTILKNKLVTGLHRAVLVVFALTTFSLIQNFLVIKIMAMIGVPIEIKVSPLVLGTWSLFGAYLAGYFIVGFRKLGTPTIHAKHENRDSSAQIKVVKAA